MGWSTIQLRDRRYEAVIHMMTAANGAETFYQNDSSGARSETLEEAREIDKKLINAWVGHPHFNIIKNTKKGFKTKIDYCLQKTLTLIGMPQPLSMTKKFLLVLDHKNPELHLGPDVKVETFQIEETFLTTSVGDCNVLHKVGKNDSYTYSHEMRLSLNGDKIQKKRQITAREYIQLLESRDSNKRHVKKVKQCFIYEAKYFMLETFQNIEPFPSILRVETTMQSASKKLPPFLQVVREVTGEKNYETWFMANKDYQMPPEDIAHIETELCRKTSN